jgi:hypothetical protein
MALDLNQPAVIDATIPEIVLLWQRGINAVRANMTYSVHSTDAGVMAEDEFLEVSEAQLKLFDHVIGEYRILKKNKGEISPSAEDAFLMSTFSHDVATRLGGLVKSWINAARFKKNIRLWLNVARNLFNLHPTPREFIRILAESYLPQISEKKINVHFDRFESRWTFRDEKTFERAKVIFTNLLENAIKYGKEGGKLEIIRQENKIIFKDDGIGMDPAFAARLGKGSQMREERAKEVEGSGIGWASIGSDMRALGWKWEIETNPGQGTTVTIHVRDGDIVPTEGEIVHPVRDFGNVATIPASQIIDGMRVFDGAAPFAGYDLVEGPNGAMWGSINVSQSPLFMAVTNAQLLLPSLSSTLIAPPALISI